MTNIPEGYELLSGRGRENAIKALKLAEERGVDPSLVRTSINPNGFLIPLGEAREVLAEPLEALTVPELKAEAGRLQIDLGDATKKADIIAVIESSDKVPVLTDESGDEKTKED